MALQIAGVVQNTKNINRSVIPFAIDQKVPGRFHSSRSTIDPIAAEKEMVDADTLRQIRPVL